MASSIAVVPAVSPPPAGMPFADLLRLSGGAMRGHPLRTALSMLGIAIGVAAVIMLTSLGEGARRYMITEFSQFGTNVLAINPGKTETQGVPGAFGGASAKLSIEDAQAPRAAARRRVRRAHCDRAGACRRRRTWTERLCVWLDG